MSYVQILPPFPTFKDVDGDPLHGGLVYIGVAGQNPISFPVNTFFDAALTIPAPQPLQTIDGYISNGGAPARVYVAQTAYSIIVRNKNSTTISFVLSQSNEFGGGTLTDALNEAPIVTLASAATVNIGAAAANTISISGVVTITSLGTIASGARRILVFQGALTLTHNAVSLILPSGASIITAASDTAEFVSLGAGNWRCVDYQRADGTAVKADVVGPGSSTDNELPLFNGATGKLLKGSSTIVTAAGLALLDDASAAAQATTLGLGAGNTPTFTALTLTNGQIIFPAIQVPSAGANTLDDYEEGTWTDVLTFATPGNLVVAYTTQTGEYTKTGRNVNLVGNIVTSTFTHTTASGNSQVTGMPFTPTGSIGCGSLIFQGITKAAYTQFGMRIVAGLTLMTIAASGSAVSASSVTTADMPTGGTVIYQYSANFNA